MHGQLLLWYLARNPWSSCPVTALSWPLGHQHLCAGSPGPCGMNVCADQSRYLGVCASTCPFHAYSLVPSYWTIEFKVGRDTNLWAGLTGHYWPSFERMLWVWQQEAKNLEFFRVYVSLKRIKMGKNYWAICRKLLECKFLVLGHTV